MLTKNDFNQFTSDVKMIHLQSLNKDCYIRQLTLKELTNYLADNKVDKPNMLARIILLCLSTETGERIFEDSDIDLVLKMPAKVAQELNEQISTFLIFTNEVVEQEAKN
jgi:hypothetical protein